MACASFLGHRFALGGPEPIPYLVSTAIGLGRMADGHHWASDTMTGAILGFAIGKAIAARQLERLSRNGSSAANGGVRASSLPLLRFSLDF
jgi:membrane-associated phospholipid phosphatase